MKYIGKETIQGRNVMVVELTERNLLTLLGKLGDPDSARTLIAGDADVAVRAVKDETHYSDRASGDVVTEHLEAGYAALAADPEYQATRAARRANSSSNGMSPPTSGETE